MKSNIPGIPGYYVSKDGLVYSSKRSGWKIRKTSLSNTGRVRVRLRNKWYHVSRLVAEIYIPNPDNLPVVMHLDNNPLNNNVNNLKWGTQSDNIQQAYNEKRLVAPKVLTNIGETHANAKLTNKLRYILVDLHLNYKVPLPKLKSIFGVSVRHISKICSDYKRGVRWT